MVTFALKAGVSSAVSLTKACLNNPITCAANFSALCGAASMARDASVHPAACNAMKQTITYVLDHAPLSPWVVASLRATLNASIGLNKRVVIAGGGVPITISAKDYDAFHSKSARKHFAKGLASQLKEQNEMCDFEHEGDRGGTRVCKRDWQAVIDALRRKGPARLI